MLGSFECATKLAGSKLIMVLGHEACGAVKDDFPEDQQNSKNLDFVTKVVEENVRITVADIRKDSPVLAELEKTGDIKIVNAIYSLHTGEVTVLD